MKNKRFRFVFERFNKSMKNKIIFITRIFQNGENHVIIELCLQFNVLKIKNIFNIKIK